MDDVIISVCSIFYFFTVIAARVKSSLPHFTVVVLHPWQWTIVTSPFQRGSSQVHIPTLHHFVLLSKRFVDLGIDRQKILPKINGSYLRISCYRGPLSYLYTVAVELCRSYPLLVMSRNSLMKSSSSSSNMGVVCRLSMEPSTSSFHIFQKCFKHIHYYYIPTFFISN